LATTKHDTTNEKFAQIDFQAELGGNIGLGALEICADGLVFFVTLALKELLSLGLKSQHQDSKSFIHHL